MAILSLARGGPARPFCPYPDSRASTSSARIQWRDRAGLSPASRAKRRIATCANPSGDPFHCPTGGRVRAPVPVSAPAAASSRLVPSFADDVYALGAGRQLAAVSAFTDEPRAAALPRVADSSSVDAEEIVALRPSLVIGIPSQARLVEPLRRAHLHVVLLPDDAYDRIFTNLQTIGALVGRRPRSRRARRAPAGGDREAARAHAPVRLASARIYSPG